MMIVVGKPYLKTLRDTKMGDEIKGKSFENSPGLTMLEYRVGMTNGKAILMFLKVTSFFLGWGVVH